MTAFIILLIQTPRNPSWGAWHSGFSRAQTHILFSPNAMGQRSLAWHNCHILTGEEYETALNGTTKMLFQGQFLSLLGLAFAFFY